MLISKKTGLPETDWRQLPSFFDPAAPWNRHMQSSFVHTSGITRQNIIDNLQQIIADSYNAPQPKSATSVSDLITLQRNDLVTLLHAYEAENTAAQQATKAIINLKDEVSTLKASKSQVELQCDLLVKDIDALSAKVRVAEEALLCTLEEIEKVPTEYNQDVIRRVLQRSYGKTP